MSAARIIGEAMAQRPDVDFESVRCGDFRISITPDGWKLYRGRVVVASGPETGRAGRQAALEAAVQR